MDNQTVKKMANQPTEAAPDIDNWVELGDVTIITANIAAVEGVAAGVHTMIHTTGSQSFIIKPTLAQVKNFITGA